MSELEDVRAMRDRLWAERVAAVAMLRLECAEYGDNDWPDTLHLADIIEKHLARSAYDALRRERESVEQLVNDEGVLAKVMRRLLEDTDQNAFVDVNPEDYPQSGTIDGNMTLEPGEAEVLARIYRSARQEPSP